MADSFGLGNPPIPMSVLFILIAVSLVFASGFLLAFIWAMNDRQFEDDHTPAVRMLFDAMPSKREDRKSKIENGIQTDAAESSPRSSENGKSKMANDRDAAGAVKFSSLVPRPSSL